MKVIHGPRGCGKTAAVIEEARRISAQPGQQAQIVCFSRREAQRLQRIIALEGLTGGLVPPITFYDFLERRDLMEQRYKMFAITHILFDNIGLALQRVARERSSTCTVSMITATSGEDW